jgi:hypothetical protein
MVSTYKFIQKYKNCKFSDDKAPNLLSRSFDEDKKTRFSNSITSLFSEIGCDEFDRAKHKVRDLW